jgi:hypothetical protein
MLRELTSKQVMTGILILMPLRVAKVLPPVGGAALLREIRRSHGNESCHGSQQP